MKAKADFSSLLKWWRDHRGMSQLALAGAAEISQRHLSFLGSARNAPSREMVLRLAVALDVPLRQHNALVAPDVLRPFLTNWSDVVRYFVRSVEIDAANDGTAETAELLARLLAYPGVGSVAKVMTSAEAGEPVLPMHFRKGDVALSLFTTIATLGTPLNVTLQELRVECFFPMDDATGRVFRSWAQAAGKKPRA